MSGNYVIEVNDASVEYYVQQRKGLSHVLWLRGSER